LGGVLGLLGLWLLLQGTGRLIALKGGASRELGFVGFPVSSVPCRIPTGTQPLNMAGRDRKGPWLVLKQDCEQGNFGGSYGPPIHVPNRLQVAVDPQAALHS